MLGRLPESANPDDVTWPAGETFTLYELRFGYADAKRIVPSPHCASVTWRTPEKNVFDVAAVARSITRGGTGGMVVQVPNGLNALPFIARSTFTSMVFFVPVPAADWSVKSPPRK